MDIIKELKKDGMLLKKIPKKEQTVDICKIAIRQNPLALQFVSRKCLDSKMCLAAVKKDGRAFRYVPSQFVTRRMCELAVEANPEFLNDVPEDFRTLKICISAVKKDVNALSYISREKRYELFDDNTEIDLIEKIVANNTKWLAYMPNRPDVKALCINCMEEDFSIAQHMPEQIKISWDILDYQKSKGKLQFLMKYYDSEEKRFIIKIKVVCGQHISLFNENNVIEESYCVQVKFEDFDKFYNFLDGNLFDAELRTYSFHGIDLKKYNIEGATINSEILELHGLYDGTYFTSIKESLKTNTDEFIDNIEIYRKFFYDLGITFLQNDLMCVEDRGKYEIIREVEILTMNEEEIRKRVQYSSVIILGGIGFSGLNKKFNASHIRYGKSFDELSREAAMQKDIQEAKRFNIIYTKILKSLNKSRVIVLTHTKKGDWNTETHNPCWIYLNGHNHRNFYEINDRRTIYADNQIGYTA